MWPKILLDLLPHLTRIVPIADNYLNSRKESDRVHEATMASLRDEVRGAFSRSADEQTTLQRDLQEHGAKLSQVGADVARIGADLEGLEQQIASIEKRMTSVTRLLWAVLCLLLVVLAGVLLRIR